MSGKGRRMRRCKMLSRLVSALAMAGLGLAAGCGGGGGGGAGSSSATFTLTDVKYGREIDEGTGTGPRLVSPLTTVSVDPITGFVVPGTLQPLAPTVDVESPQTLGLGSDYLPRVIPRNGVLQLEFSAPIDPSSVVADVVDPAGNLVSAGSVQVRTQDDKPIPVEITLFSSTKIWIDPVTPAAIGFPPSPVDFGPGGIPRADATGFLKLRLPRSGGPVLRSTGGAFLGARKDPLGEPTTPIGINPGNAVLDFIAQNQLIPTAETFNGFLPDSTAPRIVRIFPYQKTLDFSAGDSATATTVTDAAAAFSTDAKGGLGEWAGARLVLRPGGAAEEIETVVSNTRTTVTIAGTFSVLPQDG